MSPIKTVKNPLTVIAIFAGTAEISGTLILPLLETQSQQIYIWFLMLFPFILIIFFFLTLNFNHRVLYAPSDFSNEDHFVNILQKPSIQESISNMENDIEYNQHITGDDPETNDYIINNMDSEDKKSIDDTILTKTQRENETKTIRNIIRQRMKEARMAELLVLKKLEKELGAPIQRDMMIKAGTSKIIFDGVAHIGNSLTGVEVRFMRNKNTFNNSIWQALFGKFESLYNSLNESQKKSFSIIFAIVTDEKHEEIKQHIENRMEKLSFPVHIKVFDFDELQNE